MSEALPSSNNLQQRNGFKHHLNRVLSLLDGDFEPQALGEGVSVGEGKFCTFFHPSPKIFWCLRHLPQAAVRFPLLCVRKHDNLSFFLLTRALTTLRVARDAAC